MFGEGPSPYFCTPKNSGSRVLNWVPVPAVTFWCVMAHGPKSSEIIWAKQIEVLYFSSCFFWGVVWVAPPFFDGSNPSHPDVACEEWCSELDWLRCCDAIWDAEKFGHYVILNSKHGLLFWHWDIWQLLCLRVIVGVVWNHHKSLEVHPKSNGFVEKLQHTRIIICRMVGTHV